MLYTTTRNNSDFYTAQRVLTMKRGSDGGLFVPYKIPKFTEDEIAAMGSRSFNGNLAQVLNLFLGSHLNAYDIDFSTGRHSVRVQQLGQKILMGELWHNTDWDFSGMVRDLSQQAFSSEVALPEQHGWIKTAVLISVVCGIFAELIRSGIAGNGRNVDVSVVSGDFSAPMAAWYCRCMGLPIGNIICCCNENANLWDFICHGQLRTDGVARNLSVEEANVVVPEGLERLIHAYGGPQEALRYAETVHRGSTYYIEDGLLNRLRKGFYVSVSSERRILETIPSAYSTHGYLMGPASALAYAGLQDYRARRGELRTALILTDKSPALDRELIASVLDISEQELAKRM